MNTGDIIGSIDQIDINIIDISKAEFYVSESGFAGLKYNGENYKHITLKRALPINKPMEYISVADQDNKEIGILKSVKDKLGYVYMELVICVPGSDRKYSKNCAIKDVNKNIRMLSDDSLIIFDVDGNRFSINSLSKLDKNSLKRLGPFLF